MTEHTNQTLVVIGVGPGIGLHVTQLFAQKRYTKIALVARSKDNLATSHAALQRLLPNSTSFKTYALDITDTSTLQTALNDITSSLGSVECIFYNAAEIRPSPLFDTDEKRILYEFQTTCTALHNVAAWGIPQLEKLAQSDASAKPSLLVTSSLLPRDPIPFLFCLSMVKAAQRNLVQSISKQYGGSGIHVGLLVVGGQVSPDAETLNPSNIAEHAWKWFDQSKEEQTLDIEVL